MRRLFLPMLVLLGVTALAGADVAVPPLRQRVTDLTGTLSPAQRQELESRLQAFETRKGSQIAVLMLSTTAPEAIEAYALRVAEAWKLGRQGVDDGVLFLIAKDDRAMRLEVGYGLEGAVPDAVAKRLISEVVTPYFKRGDLPGGVAAGVDRLIAIIDGEPLPDVALQAPGLPAAMRSIDTSRLVNNLPFLMIAVVVFGQFLRALIGRLLGGLLAGGLVALVVWFLVYSLLAALVAGVMVFVLLALSSSSTRRSNYGGFPSGRSYGGYRGSSGGFRSSSSGGGFRGGGGSFGGGGASGRW
ncbi:MAG: YgcG family protein [Lentisphaerae bacterium]|nr:YgcG family protein [Lentisphaerota bacterium]